ncbi:MAG: DUF5348 domain-containing protein [Clostridia bacterium]|nr:DUF5348 domain-containing protein [Clostridia bacterium]
MDNNYLKLNNQLTNLKADLQKLIDTGSTKSFEDKIAYGYIESLFDSVDMAIYKIEHFSKPTIEGTLHENASGKFDLLDRSGKYITYFSCGSPIECFIEEDGEKQWIAGRVEHTTKNGNSGYYFYGGDKPFLHNGMRARIRKD